MAADAANSFTMQQELIIDGSQFSDYEGFVEEFNRAYLPMFGEPPWDGASFLELDEYLEAAQGANGERVSLRWINSQKSRSDLGHEEMAKFWLRTIAKIPRWSFSPAGNEFIRRGYEELLGQARAGQGRTLFEWIVWQISGDDSDDGERYETIVDLKLE